MKKVTIARLVTTAASVAGAILCPKLVESDIADTAIKAGIATLTSALPDGIKWTWNKSKEYEIKTQVTHTPAETITPQIPSADVKTTEIHVTAEDGVEITRSKQPVGNKAKS